MIYSLHLSNLLYFPDTINCLAWSPDSRELASSGFSDRTIRVWHNPIGVKALLKDLKHKLTKVKTDSHKVSILVLLLHFVD